MEAIVEYNYEAREADELTLKKGDIIKNIKVLEGGWWEGTLKDKRGMFPDNFVKVLDSSSGAAGGTEIVTVADKKEDDVVVRNGGSGRKWCKVLFSYEPVNLDELKLVPQDSIEFLGEVEEGWWRGQLRGQIGVFPSNFVAPPIQEDKQLYRVLFPYEAVNEDELTITDGDIITLLSKDALDKGWWKGELKGKIGLFPDNFVELLVVKNGEQEQKQELSQVSKVNKGALPVPTTKGSHSNKRSEKAHVRKSVDLKNVRTGGGNDSVKKKSPDQSIISSLKRFVGDGSNNGGNGSATAALGEELDEVERGEGVPLSHLTASRAKAPRRRLPTTQHLRHHTTTTTPTTHTNTTTSPTTVVEENMTNGNMENSKSREDEGDGVVSKVRRKAPWVEELKLNQLERKKTTVDKVDKPEGQKEKPRAIIPNIAERAVKVEVDNDEGKTKDEEKTKRTATNTQHSPPQDSIPSPPGYVSYHIFNQLLERVCLLEENQLTLQRTVQQLAQMIPNLPNSITNKE